MTKIVVDEALRNKLLDLTQPLELCDESGRVLASVFPKLDLSQYEPLEPQISEEELTAASKRLSPTQQKRC